MLYDLARKSCNVSTPFANSFRDREREPRRRLFLSFRDIDQGERLSYTFVAHLNVQIIVTVASQQATNILAVVHFRFPHAIHSYIHTRTHGRRSCRRRKLFDVRIIKKKRKKGDSTKYNSSSKLGTDRMRTHGRFFRVKLRVWCNISE